MKKKLLAMLLAGAMLAGIAPVNVLAVSDHEHNHVEHVKTVDPTCTEAGYTVYKCDQCKQQKTTKLDALDHDFSVSLGYVDDQAPTCTDAAREEMKCSRCTEQTTVDVDPLPHELEAVEAKAPTCVEAGHNAHKACVDCDYTEGFAEIPATGIHSHTVFVSRTEPTCTAEGREVYKCETCKQQKTVVLDALGHDYSVSLGYVNGKAPTCTEGTKEQMKCSRCHVQKSVDIDPLPHELQDVEAKAPTCVVTGYEAYKACANCDYTEGYTEIPATGVHNHTVHVKTVDATCTEEGYTVYKCESCPQQKTTTLDPLGHDYSEFLGWNYDVEPTCTEGASAQYKCSRCRMQKTVEVEPLGHDHSVYMHAEKEPTCTEGGYDRYKCSRCPNQNPWVAVPALGHTEETIPAVAPGCEEAGLSEGTKCSVCNELLEMQQTVAATGHAWDEGRITTAATAKADGIKTYTCKNNTSHTKTEAVKYVAPAANKDYDDVPKTGDNTAVLLIVMTGIALACAMAFVFGKKRSAC